MKRTDIINDIIKLHGYQSYLEIGVRNKNQNYNNIKCARKMGVDPALHSDKDGIYGTTSDLFFQDTRYTFDIIFIDGDHTFNQVAKDVNNALMALNHDGCLVLHDCLPKTKAEAARVDPKDGHFWCGGVYAVYMLAVEQLPEEERFVIDIDHGVAVIKPSTPSYILIEHCARWDEYQEAVQNNSLNIIKDWSYEHGHHLLHR